MTRRIVFCGRKNIYARPEIRLIPFPGQQFPQMLRRLTHFFGAAANGMRRKQGRRCLTQCTGADLQPKGAESPFIINANIRDHPAATGGGSLLRCRIRAVQPSMMGNGCRQTQYIPVIKGGGHKAAL